MRKGGLCMFCRAKRYYIKRLFYEKSWNMKRLCSLISCQLQCMNNSSVWAPNHLTSKIPYTVYLVLFLPVLVLKVNFYSGQCLLLLRSEIQRVYLFIRLFESGTVEGWTGRFGVGGGGFNHCNRSWIDREMH